jgi:L-malate glycosyltransferase
MRHLKDKVRSYIRCTLAQSILYFSYAVVARFSRYTDRRGKYAQSSGKILVIGTFHNPNWFHSHIEPLCQCGVQEVILVCDKPMEPKKRLRFACPPRFLSHCISRAGAKFLWTIFYGMRHRPDLYMGYHIFPGALSALVVARIFNRPACYQVTSGPTELEGGGWLAENRLLAALQTPSSRIEKQVNRLVAEYDLVIVRGSKAKKYIRDIGYNRQLAIITGSAAAPITIKRFDERDIDVIFVGRLADTKRPDRFVSIIKMVKKQKEDVGAKIVGDGPNGKELESQITADCLNHNLELLGQRKDVPELLGRSKIFVLTSRSEGLSIAMIEAMMAGVVPVVADVGDLRDLVDDGINGFVIDGDDLATFSLRVARLLEDRDLWLRCSKSALESATAYSSLNVVAGKWREQFEVLLEKGHNMTAVDNY